jgi:hypothetical protein
MLQQFPICSNFLEMPFTFGIEIAKRPFLFFQMSATLGIKN